MDDNEEISDIKSIANAFNNYFSNIGAMSQNQGPAAKAIIITIKDFRKRNKRRSFDDLLIVFIVF